MTLIKMNPDKEVDPLLVMARRQDLQAMFKECLRRYKEAREHPDAPLAAAMRTDRDIIELSFETLLKNGYSRDEIVAAMR